ncbi:EAL and HDOD domain-containing protein [Aliidiomarina celeris]|uniref:EAL and HDOD domain-containing protein n=1 Tax=Aliidiomarina celeris TaxID=2249428 RepID=UPI000DE807D1|nr:HDOD domain-containing protein [Aliidiomarina celeris]
MFFYIARQPILDRKKSLYAYELLFRNGTDNAFPDISAEAATASLIENSQFQTNINEITNSNLAFINFSEIALLQELPTLLPPKEIVVEILESVQPTEAVFTALRSLKKKGYRLALDDFNFDPKWFSVLNLIDIVKVDLTIANDTQVNHLRSLTKQYNFELLAEKVETEAQFSKFFALGFQYFQGYFFARPELLQRKSFAPNMLVYTQLLQACAQTEIDFTTISNVFAQDVGLTYKLLRYVNSTAFGYGRNIETLKQAIVFLGEVELKKFASLIATAQLANSKPTELVKLSMIRARLCELIAEHAEIEINSERAFLTGMFSVLDAILDEDFNVILSRIEVNEEIQDALILKKGKLAYCLSLIQNYEQANWQRVSWLAERLQIDSGLMPELYTQALQWSESLSKSE